MLFLKILDEKDQELELIRENYNSVIPEKFQWRTWATDPEGITGDELLSFIDHPTDGLFAHLKQLQSTKAPKRAAIDYVRDKSEKTLSNEATLQQSITGWEYKPVAYVLGLTNLILHGIDVPDYHYQDSLKVEYNGIGPKQQVNCILANPPFGAGIADGVETNFPASFRCKESADLFVILMIQLLKANGRCAIVLPDGCITGDGYKERIREKLLADCNLHTIVHLPQSTFHPATVSTNLLFFTKGSPTKEIWYYEHRLPAGQKSDSNTKVIQFDEFAPMIEWWDKREENEVACKVKVEDLKDGFDLDVKNPTSSEVEETLSVKKCLSELRKSLGKVETALKAVETEYTGK